METTNIKIARLDKRRSRHARSMIMIYPCTESNVPKRNRHEPPKAALKSLVPLIARSRTRTHRVNQIKRSFTKRLRLPASSELIISTSAYQRPTLRDPPSLTRVFCTYARRVTRRKLCCSYLKRKTTAKSGVGFAGFKWDREACGKTDIL